MKFTICLESGTQVEVSMDGVLVEDAYRTFISREEWAQLVAAVNGALYVLDEMEGEEDDD